MKYLHLSVTRTWGNRTLPTSSRQWKALSSQILHRDNCTCAWCGYLSKTSPGRAMIVDHKDGNASNNDPLNLRVHCPPCDAIRHCGFAGINDWIVVGQSDMDQVEIVRKTREMFQSSAATRIPLPMLVDPSMVPVEMGPVAFANILLKQEWEELPEEFRRFRGFFTEHASRLFLRTM